MNIVERWIASHFVKRFALSLASGAAAYLAAHSLPEVTHLDKLFSILQSLGITIKATIEINPEKFADAAAVIFGSLAQGGHEYAAAKWPNIGRYL